MTGSWFHNKQTIKDGRQKGKRKDKQVSLKSCPAILLYESIYRNKGIQARSQNRFETGCSAHLPLGQEEIFDILDTKHKQSGKIKAESIISLLILMYIWIKDVSESRKGRMADA